MKHSAAGGAAFARHREVTVVVNRVGPRLDDVDDLVKAPEGQLLARVVARVGPEPGAVVDVAYLLSLLQSESVRRDPQRPQLCRDLIGREGA